MEKDYENIVINLNFFKDYSKKILEISRKWQKKLDLMIVNNYEQRKISYII